MKPEYWETVKAFVITHKVHIACAAAGFVLGAVLL
jgi:hypothetical protein